MPSMRNIFIKKGIEIGSNVNDPLQKQIDEKIGDCGRSGGERIVIDDTFRNMWMNGYSIRPERDDLIKIYQLVASEESSKNKYLKYKAKYLLLKKKLDMK